LPAKRKTARQIREAGTLPKIGLSTGGRSMQQITVKISPTVTPEQLQDPRFISLLEESERFFDCRNLCCFSEIFRILLCLHEAGHAYFAKKAGASVIEFHGPMMCWDTRPGHDEPAISRATTTWIWNGRNDVVNSVAAFLAGYICRREMSHIPNNEICIGADRYACRVWFDRWVGTGDIGFEVALEDAEKAILEDLNSPEVRKDIWAEARRCGEIFPRHGKR
jgi:hypothetical protein